MFVQVIIGRVADAEDLRHSMRRWTTDLAPGATGWLGSTAGLTADRTFLCLARFASAEAARRNSDRPEQHQWWMETAKAFEAEPAFHDCDRPMTFLGGPSERAGFVQVVQGHTTAPERLRELSEHTVDHLARLRPDLIGGLVAIAGDGTVHRAVYFTSEAAARRGERIPPPPEVAAQMSRYVELVPTETFHDLAEPWHFTTR
ncbi:hypothetical protein GCM10010124_01620 [Pilimelia terevasa]|uniref:Uncharacterized protein n=1 Tax=Pilimelia terevasa TaxID=53372 RepID=A0A8J3BD38_9ACTN|nr:hypothetical protein [Pilimelia terevasa]GGK12761.1 hypothetical protein GCM10010124_01620 [Pilimelia terevasa]